MIKDGDFIENSTQDLRWLWLCVRTSRKYTTHFISLPFMLCKKLYYAEERVMKVPKS